MNKTAREYYDAVMSGNSEDAERLKSELNGQVKLAQRSNSVSPTAVNTLLGDDKTPALYVYNFLNDKYKDHWWEWEIETIEQDLWKDYGLVFTDSMADKVQAVKLLVNSQRPFLDWWYFNQLSNAFCGTIADFTSIKSPSPGMAIATMKTMHAIRPEENFSRDVKKYVCLLLIHEGIYTPPPSVSDILMEEFEDLVSKETRDGWQVTLQKASDMINDKEYGESDDPINIQARRLLVAEHAANKFGG